MTVAAIEARLSGPADLFVHIGAGEGALDRVARRAGRAVLIEADPDQFAELESRLSGASSVELKHAVIADNAQSVTFKRMSLPEFGSPRAVTGARRLYRGLKPVGDVEIEGTTLDALVGAMTPGAAATIIIDTPSEALTALNQLEAAGLLTPEAQICVKVSELALHEGGATRQDVQAWAAARGLQLQRVEGDGDPDIWSAWLVPGAASKPMPTPTAQAPVTSERPVNTAMADERVAQDTRAEPADPVEALREQVSALEAQLDAQGKLVRKHRNKAYRTTKQLEKKRAALDSATAEDEARIREIATLTDQVKALSDAEAALRKAAIADRAQREALGSQVDEFKARLAASELERADQDRELETRQALIEALREELASEQRLRQARDQENEAQAGEIASLSTKLSQAAIADSTIRDRILGLESDLKAVLEQREADAELHQTTDAQRQSLAERLTALETELAEAQARADTAEATLAAVTPELESAKQARDQAQAALEEQDEKLTQAREEAERAGGNLSLAMRTQNMVQSDIRDLQARYETLKDEKAGLEELLAKLLDRLYDASEQANALSWAETVTEDDPDASSKSER